ncbi:MAG: hypothetical protein HY903_03310 [Deltaproteobacteria bacterium]|nr:hypothetical protein [Deltaproteobacteria bacterium]
MSLSLLISMTASIVANGATASGPEATAVTPTALAPPSAEVVLMPLTSLGSTEQSLAAVEGVLAAELAKLASARFATAASLAAADPELAAGLVACDGVVSCLVDLLRTRKLTALVVGNVAGLGDHLVLNLKLIDVTSGAERRRAREEMSGGDRELIKPMRRAAVMLLAPERLTGELEVRATQVGVRLFIDGDKVATAPLAASRFALLAGRHAVEAKGDGLVPMSTMVDIAYDEVSTLDVLLPPNTLFIKGGTPFRAQWWTWVVGGAGVASLGVAGGYYRQHYLAAAEIERRAAAGSLDANDSSLRRAWQKDLQRARIAASLGAALVLSTGVLWLVDLL